MQSEGREHYAFSLKHIHLSYIKLRELLNRIFGPFLKSLFMAIACSNFRLGQVLRIYLYTMLKRTNGDDGVNPLISRT
ncbi:hypothetical protein JMJ77_0001400 [Colletotrichum scovillei]|uniref:Uncharacterized protein n=1 Tax=Colletotrichum scovillei TaxID=1209932 RepID=A0A9P7RBI6_9PEZI|nr:hypothetical protein JMJ77_0001400 [Colletotrichum scovillei]KAG7072625.1 hypothetical protein JMJ76_0005472 [Colletotrichum scovillei]KAG7080904.1 hypothetical protein JMJ78_0007987 [Colletotrichum scovillei]